MTHSNEEVAKAFSSHKYAETYPFLSAGVRWNNVGGEEFSGRDAVIARAQASADYLARVATEILEFKVTCVPDCIVVESITRYREDDELSTVASCDIYRFSNDRLDEITSYNIELKS